MKKLISHKLLEKNDGQIKGLPKNPRFIRDEKYNELVESIRKDPEFLDYRGLLVYPYKNKYVVIGGNQRLTACIDAGMEKIPCEVLKKETPIEKLRTFTVKDNASYGEWDFGFIEVSEWLEVFQEDETIGVELPQKMQEHLENGFKEVSKSLNLDYTIFFDSKEECDMFYAFLVKLKNKFSGTENVSKRVLQWIAELYEENGELEESQLLMKMIKIDMEFGGETKKEKINYSDVKI